MPLSSVAVIISSFLFYCWYYFLHYGKKPEVYKKQSSKFSAFLENHVKSVSKPYWSLFWSPGGKLQTIVAAILPRFYNEIYYWKETVETPDGGKFGLAWASNSRTDNVCEPLVVIFPGLVSSSTTGYVQLMVQEIINKGFSAVVMVNRGIEIPCQNSTFFCATYTTDMELAINTIKKRFPKRPVAAAGVSFGGLLLSRYLALKGESSKLQAAFVYSCPYSPVECSISMEKWNHWLLMNVSVTSGLMSVYRKSKDKFDGLVDHHTIKRVCSVRQFDSEMTAKVFGYKTVDHYYKDGVITSKFIHSIRTPTLCLCANDDAFVPVKSIPCSDISQTDYVAMMITNGGGHVGHLQGINPYSTPYFVDVLTDYFSAVFNYSEALPTTGCT